MNVGFTGTRVGMTDEQKDSVTGLLLRFREDAFEAHWFRHGNCKGADEQALEIATKLNFKTMAYPIDMPDLQIPLSLSTEAQLVKPPLTRNRHIVRDSEVMIAAPKEEKEPVHYRSSGTWFTINHCRKQNVKRDLYIVWPNGVITSEEY